MAQACGRCGGVGYGELDPEFGWRRGSSKGDAPAPCPDCQGRFATYIKDSTAVAVVDTKKVRRHKEPTYGVYIEPIFSRPQDILVVGGGSASQLAMDEYDPGVVNTGSEKVSIEEALAVAGTGEEA